MTPVGAIACAENSRSSIALSITSKIVLPVPLCVPLAWHVWVSGWVETGGGPPYKGPRRHQDRPHQTSGPGLRGEVQRAEELPGGSPQGGVHIDVSSPVFYARQPLQVCVLSLCPSSFLFHFYLLTFDLNKHVKSLLTECKPVHTLLTCACGALTNMLSLGQQSLHLKNIHYLFHCLL